MLSSMEYGRGAADEAAWLGDLVHADPATEVAPGVTAGAYVRFHARPPDPPGAVFESRVYASHAGRDLALHVYRRATRDERQPGVVLIHGGGWREMSPFMLIRYAHRLAAAGFVAACPAYRFSSTSRWPAQLEDVQAAIEYLRAASVELGLDPARLSVLGNSAGGQLAFLTAARSADVRAAVLLYPVADLRAGASSTLAASGAVTALLGSADERLVAEASPCDQVRPGLPPTLTIVGDADDLTPAGAVEELHRRLGAAGVESELVVLRGRGHAFDLLPAEWETTSACIVSFLVEHLPPARSRAGGRGGPPRTTGVSLGRG